MSNQHETSETQHVEAVLEPITPSSRYDFVEIEQEPISFSNPFKLLIPCVLRWIKQMLSLARSIWLPVLGLLLVLVIIEFSLRAIEPRLTGRVYDASMTGGHPLAMNAQGFRGESVTESKPENTKRVIALGDSVTMGTGVAADQTWAAQLQSLLNTPDQPFQVINTGLPTLDIGQMELELRTRWAAYEPDEIVLVATGNMISFALARGEDAKVVPPDPKKRAETRIKQESGIKAVLKSAYTDLAIPNALILGIDHLKYAVGLESHQFNAQFPVGVMPAFGYVQNDADPEMTTTAYRIFEQQLGTLKATADELGLPLTIVYAPPRFSLDDSLMNNLKFVDHDRLVVDPGEQIQSVCASLGINFVDPRDSLRASDDVLYVLSDYTHFSPQGHRVLAQSIADQITTQK